ncbi:MAG: 5'-nucleotidase C-terminal domain-containing protein [Pseudomonadota bacterium]
MHAYKHMLGATSLLVAGALVSASAQADLRLTILHNNDGESQLINAGSGELEDFGGIARFARVVRDLRTEGDAEGATVVLGSGDQFLAGPEFNVSLERGVPFYDALGLDLIGYDALALGNHEFDFNPDVLCQFIDGFAAFPTTTKFVSANLDFTNEPCLAARESANVLGDFRVVEKNGELIGIVGATTADLDTISSPRDVIINDVLPAVQRAVNALRLAGINKIILISHLQSITEEQELATQLRGVDVIIGGGGDELLGDEDTLIVPGDDEDGFFGPYPLTETDALGREVPIVVTPGSYKYVGRLVVDFDDDGIVTNIDSKSGLVRVAGGDNADAVDGLPFVQALVVDPVIAGVEELAETVIATTEVGLDGIRSNIRTEETNLGNLIADAFLSQATELALEFGAPAPDVALANGGGIRNDDIRGPGDITALDTFDILPFSNLLTIVPNVSRESFKEILENAVSAVEFTSGRFAQIGGFTMTYDPAAQAQDIEDGVIVVTGERVIDAVLADGTVLVENGAVQAGDALNIAIVDFLARGGDEYPFGDAEFTILGVSYQQALRNFIEGDLAGVVTAADYPEGGEGRIVALD